MSANHGTIERDTQHQVPDSKYTCIYVYVPVHTHTQNHINTHTYKHTLKQTNSLPITNLGKLRRQIEDSTLYLPPPA